MGCLPTLDIANPLLVDGREDLATDVAASYDGQAMRLFLNGVQVASAPKSGAVALAPDIEAWRIWARIVGSWGNH